MSRILRAVTIIQAMKPSPEGTCVSCAGLDLRARWNDKMLWFSMNFPFVSLVKFSTDELQFIAIRVLVTGANRRIMILIEPSSSSLPEILELLTSQEYDYLGAEKG
ncbi:hypothetical protein TNCV_4755901 [Trichonephila clavipes]|nr:hypothetical protein TNCV_4755901 [Trichonephila clavipes]